MIDLEICADSFETALAAEKFHAKRIELCANLNEGGTTPSFGMIQKCAALKSVEVHVMIRPRSGSFIYTEIELDIMARDIVTSAIAGAKGVVFGCLTKENELDLPSTLFLCEAALKQKMEITFHRAIDFIDNYEKTLDDLINMGVTRILTSGGKNTAIEGIERIKEIVELSKNKIQVMAGSGVNSSNAKQLISTGIQALHFTARKKINSSLDLNMGEEYEVDEDKILAIQKKIS